MSGAYGEWSNTARSGLSRSGCLGLCPALPALPYLLGVGIEGISPKPEQEMVWEVACGIITAGGFKRTSGFTEFYDTCKGGRFTHNMPPPTNPGVRWRYPCMDYQPLRKKTPYTPKPLSP